MEDVPSGGSSLDPCPTETNPHQDGIDAAAIFLQSPTTADATCFADRDPADGAWRLTDAVAGTRRQPDFVSRVRGAMSSHQALTDILHFLPEGPGDGWASGAYRTRTGTAPNGGGYVWWSDSSQTRRIIDMTNTYPAGSILPSSRAWRLYTTSGAVAIQVVDTLQWTGPVLTACIRTWA